MRQHLNTLFVTREGAYLAKDGAAVEVRQDGQSLLRVPLHNLDGIVALGYDIGASAHLMAACAQAGSPCRSAPPMVAFWPPPRVLPPAMSCFDAPNIVCPTTSTPP